MKLSLGLLLFTFLSQFAAAQDYRADCGGNFGQFIDKFPTKKWPVKLSKKEIKLIQHSIRQRAEFEEVDQLSRCFCPGQATPNRLSNPRDFHYFYYGLLSKNEHYSAVLLISAHTSIYSPAERKSIRPYYFPEVSLLIYSPTGAILSEERITMWRNYFRISCEIEDSNNIEVFVRDGSKKFNNRYRIDTTGRIEVKKGEK